MFWFVNDGGPLLIAPRRALGAWEGGDPSSAAGPSPSNGSTNQPDQRRTTTVRAQSGSQSGLSRLAKVGASKEPLCRALAGQGLRPAALRRRAGRPQRSEEHTSELQSRFDLVCRLLLEKKKKNEEN